MSNSLLDLAAYVIAFLPFPNRRARWETAIAEKEIDTLTPYPKIPVDFLATAQKIRDAHLHTLPLKQQEWLRQTLDRIVLDTHAVEAWTTHDERVPDTEWNRFDLACKLICWVGRGLTGQLYKQGDMLYLVIHHPRDRVNRWWLDGNRMKEVVRRVGFPSELQRDDNVLYSRIQAARLTTATEQRSHPFYQGMRLMEEQYQSRYGAVLRPDWDQGLDIFKQVDLSIPAIPTLNTLRSVKEDDWKKQPDGYAVRMFAQLFGSHHANQLLPNLIDTLPHVWWCWDGITASYILNLITVAVPNLTPAQCIQGLELAQSLWCYEWLRLVTGLPSSMRLQVQKVEWIDEDHLKQERAANQKRNGWVLGQKRNLIHPTAPYEVLFHYKDDGSPADMLNHILQWADKNTPDFIFPHGKPVLPFVPEKQTASVHATALPQGEPGIGDLIVSLAGNVIVVAKRISEMQKEVLARTISWQGTTMLQRNPTREKPQDSKHAVTVTDFTATRIFGGERVGSSNVVAKLQEYLPQIGIEPVPGTGVWVESSSHTYHKVGTLAGEATTQEVPAQQNKLYWRSLTHNSWEWSRTYEGTCIRIRAVDTDNNAKAYQGYLDQAGQPAFSGRKILQLASLTDVQATLVAMLQVRYQANNTYAYTRDSFPNPAVLTLSEWLSLYPQRKPNPDSQTEAAITSFIEYWTLPDTRLFPVIVAEAELKADEIDSERKRRQGSTTTRLRFQLQGWIDAILADQGFATASLIDALGETGPYWRAVTQQHRLGAGMITPDQKQQEEERIAALANRLLTLADRPYTPRKQPKKKFTLLLTNGQTIEVWGKPEKHELFWSKGDLVGWEKLVGEKEEQPVPTKQSAQPAQTTTTGAPTDFSAEVLIEHAIPEEVPNRAQIAHRIWEGCWEHADILHWWEKVYGKAKMKVAITNAFFEEGASDWLTDDTTKALLDRLFYLLGMEAERRHERIIPDDFRIMQKILNTTDAAQAEAMKSGPRVQGWWLKNLMNTQPMRCVLLDLRTPPYRVVMVEARTLAAGDPDSYARKWAAAHPLESFHWDVKPVAEPEPAKPGVAGPPAAVLSDAVAQNRLSYKFSYLPQSDVYLIEKMVLEIWQQAVQATWGKPWNDDQEATITRIVDQVLATHQRKLEARLRMGLIALLSGCLNYQHELNQNIPPEIAVRRFILEKQTARIWNDKHHNVKQLPTGWLAKETSNGVAFLADQQLVEFEARDPKSGTNLHRARTYGQAWAERTQAPLPDWGAKFTTQGFPAQDTRWYLSIHGDLPSLKSGYYDSLETIVKLYVKAGCPHSPTTGNSIYAVGPDSTRKSITLSHITLPDRFAGMPRAAAEALVDQGIRPWKMCDHWTAWLLDTTQDPADPTLVTKLPEVTPIYRQPEAAKEEAAPADPVAWNQIHSQMPERFLRTDPEHKVAQEIWEKAWPIAQRVDWSTRDHTQAQMRLAIKHVLKKHNIEVTEQHLQDLYTVLVMLLADEPERVRIGCPPTIRIQRRTPYRAELGEVRQQQNTLQQAHGWWIFIPVGTLTPRVSLINLQSPTEQSIDVVARDPRLSVEVLKHWAQMYAQRNPLEDTQAEATLQSRVIPLLIKLQNILQMHELPTPKKQLELEDQLHTLLAPYAVNQAVATPLPPEQLAVMDAATFQNTHAATLAAIFTGRAKTVAKGLFSGRGGKITDDYYLKIAAYLLPLPANTHLTYAIQKGEDAWYVEFRERAATSNQHSLIALPQEHIWITADGRSKLNWNQIKRLTRE